MRTKGKEPLFHIAKRDALPWHKSFGIRLAAIAAALVVCGILTTVLTGINPIQVYVSIFMGAFGTARKTWITFQNVAILLLIAMIAIGACLPITATPELHDMHVLYHGQELLLHDHNVVSGALGIVEGLKNGAAVFGKSVLTLFLNAFADYLDGFHGTLDGHIFWMLFGWIKALWDNIWLTFCRYGASLWYTFRQSNGIGYCAGYITSTVISWVICSHLSKTEEEHVAAMKKK